MKTMQVKTKKVIVDEETRISVNVNGKWIEDIEICSQFTEDDALQYIRSKYNLNSTRL